MSRERKSLPLVFISFATLLNIFHCCFCSTYERGTGEINEFSPFAESATSSTLVPGRADVRLKRGSVDASAVFTDKTNQTPQIPLRTSNSSRNDETLTSNSHNISLLRSFQKRAFDVESQIVSSVRGARIPGPQFVLQNGHSSPPTDVRKPLPRVHCSKEKMTLTADGNEYTNILVKRDDATPLPLFQLPASCGYSVKVTWKDLVLTIPFDACYVFQENRSYVLSLLWWGSPIKISCPMTQAMSKPNPSILCSQFGMVISVEGAWEVPEKHRVKVNGEVLPLVSKTCARRILSPSDVVLLHIALNSGCVPAGKSSIVIILDGKQFSLSCEPPHQLPGIQPYDYSSFSQPLQPSQKEPYASRFPVVSDATRRPSPKRESGKSLVLPQLPFAEAVDQFHLGEINNGQNLPHQTVVSPNLPMYPQFPFHFAAPHFDFRQPYRKQEDSYIQHPRKDGGGALTFPSPYAHHYPMMHPYYPPYPFPPYPFLHPYPFPPYRQSAITTPPPTIAPKPPTLKPRLALQPLTPPVQQNSLWSFLPTPPTFPPKMNPSLNCTKTKLIAMLPFAKRDSIKIKDVETNLWVSISRIPEACNYALHLRGDAVMLTSPLPSCHTKELSSSITSLSVKFWDSSQLRHRVLQLQCHSIADIVDSQSTLLTPSQPNPKVQVSCSNHHMVATLPPGPTSGLSVQALSSDSTDLRSAVAILEAPRHCGYSVERAEDGAINIRLPYSSCHMTQQDGSHKIILKYETPSGRKVETLLSCQASASHECKVPVEHRLLCGSAAVSPAQCHDKGCCYSTETDSCYYPMDECTMDRHFVFSIYSSAIEPPLSPASLVTAGNGSCGPHKVTDDVALFKIPLDECGVHRYEVGKTVIYMVEILNRVQPFSLNYGTITRDSPVRILVECRYLPGSVVSVGYLVKSPSLGPSIKAQGVFGVQLRISKDEHYNSFHPQYHQPLRMLLGKPLYLEVRLLNPPDPSAVLLVHYCVAYPRSAQTAWIIIYDGCPNFLDQTPTHKPPATPAEPLVNHVRRFTITTFQFLPDDDVKADEEIYFMCSTEVCLPADGQCVEGCFGDANVKI